MFDEIPTKRPHFFFLIAGKKHFALKKCESRFVANVFRQIPMGRIGQPREVAALLSWLASEECSFSTGAVFDLSGGPCDLLTTRYAPL